VVFRRGKYVQCDNLVIDDETEIRRLEQEMVYEYLGNRLVSIQYERMKYTLKKKYTGKLKFI
jgi:hypothetical protein